MPGVRTPTPRARAFARLRRERIALASGFVFLLLVSACMAAPLWAGQVAHTTPAENHLSDTIVIDAKRTNVVALDGVPIGPTWRARFFLGADGNGRDTMVRLLYGGRNSLLIGVSAALLTTLVALVLGLVAGYFRGIADAVIARALDVIWAFPAIILAVALGVALTLGGLQIGPVTIPAGSKLIAILIIGAVTVPYLARPIRAEVLLLRERDFVEAARAQGAGPLRIMRSELLPNVVPTLIVFFPLLVANAILLEAALSYLGAGIQPPEASWGTMISDGIDSILSAVHLTLVPGGMLVATVLSLNVFADGVRDAVDPRARVRLEH